MLRVDRLRVIPLPPLSFAVEHGECLAVEGPSGSGKTRLLRAIADLDPSEGFVSLDGSERGTVPAPLWRRRVRYVAAEPAWWAQTPRQHFAAPNDLVVRLVESLGLDRSVLARDVVGLSTGERQRLALARALADDPAVLLLDEPTAALDAASAALAERLVLGRIEAGRSVILVSHDAHQIERIAHARLQLGPPAAGPFARAAGGRP